MADVDMNVSVYDYNQNIMRQWPIIEGEGIDNVKKELAKYAAKTPADQYLMMLCREKNDYTLFNFKSCWDDEQFAEDVLDCFENRGVGLVECRIVDDGVAVEIWVKKPGQMESADLYYIFPADELVITY